MAEQGEALFGYVAEGLPAGGRVEVASRGAVRLPKGFVKCCSDRSQGMLCVRVSGGEVAGKAFGEAGVTDRDGGAHDRGQIRGKLRGGVETGGGIDVGEQAGRGVCGRRGWHGRRRHSRFRRRSGRDGLIAGQR